MIIANSRKPAAIANTITSPMSALADIELVGLCQQRDQKAFAELFKRHQNLVNGMLYKLASDWNDSSDLSQEVFVRVWQGIPKLQNPKVFKSWLCQIVQHLFYDELRKKSRRFSTLSLDSSSTLNDDYVMCTRDVADGAARPDELLERKDTQQIVVRAMDKLPEAFRTAMILRDLDDMTYEDISVVTNTDIGTIKSRISRARTKVQRILRPEFRPDKELSACVDLKKSA